MLGHAYIERLNVTLCEIPGCGQAAEMSVRADDRGSLLCEKHARIVMLTLKQQGYATHFASNAQYMDPVKPAKVSKLSKAQLDGIRDGAPKGYSCPMGHVDAPRTSVEKAAEGNIQTGTLDVDALSMAIPVEMSEKDEYKQALNKLYDAFRFTAGMYVPMPGTFVRVCVEGESYDLSYDVYKTGNKKGQRKNLIIKHDGREITVNSTAIRGFSSIIHREWPSNGKNWAMFKKA